MLALVEVAGTRPPRLSGLYYGLSRTYIEADPQLPDGRPLAQNVPGANGTRINDTEQFQTASKVGEGETE